VTWVGVVRWFADLHAAISDGLYLAADLLDPDAIYRDDEIIEPAEVAAS
jgi:hypothetical protein